MLAIYIHLHEELLIIYKQRSQELYHVWRVWDTMTQETSLHAV